MILQYIDAKFQAANTYVHYCICYIYVIKIVFMKIQIMLYSLDAKEKVCSWCIENSENGFEKYIINGI